MKAVIVDDEADSRRILAGYLARYCPEVTVCGFGESVATGLEAIRAHRPDLVFLDIEMPYGNGFDLLDQASPVNFETVFVTAFDGYAIQALNQSAAYYLLKPIDIDELVKAVEKIKSERRTEAYTEHAKVLLDNLRGGNTRIMLPTMEGFEIVDIDTILYCEANDNFTQFHFAQGNPLMICRPLRFFEEVLASHRFLRVHRSFLINTAHVVRFTKGKGGTVTMKNGAELEISPNRKSEFLEFFGQ